jgi:hypothetical protein
MKKLLFPLFFSGCILLGHLAVQGANPSLVQTFFPMRDEDWKTYDSVYGSTTRSYAETQFQGKTVFEETDSSMGSRSLIGYSTKGLTLYSVEKNGINLVFKTPLVPLTDQILQNGGTLTTQSSISFMGVSATVTMRVTVSMAGSVTVPTGTYSDCRMMSSVLTVKAYGQMQTLSSDDWVLAPGIGRIKISLVDQDLQPLGWAEMTDGVVNGYSVHDPIPDLIEPTVSITSPAANARLNNAQVVLSGTASDNIGIDRVEYQIGAGDFQAATGTGSWQAALILAPGTNVIQVRAVDLSGNVSPTATWRLIYIVPSPFVALKGVYSGLFYVEAGVQPNTAGAVSLTLSDNGKYTGKLLLAGTSHSFTGAFDPHGLSRVLIKRSKQETLTVDLQLDLGGSESLDGTVTTPSWTAVLKADRGAVYDGKIQKAPQAGLYTLLIPGSPDAANGPFGHGFGNVTVDAKGNLSFKGTLADGTAISQGSTVSRNGHWPLYASVNQGRGILIGWINFADQPSSDFYGLNVNWVKVKGPDRYYPDGFVLAGDILGSRFVVPSPAGEGSMATLTLQGPGLTEDLTEQVFLNAKNQVIVFGNNPAKLKLTYTAASGLFSGTFQPPGAPKALTLKGAVVQKGAQGGGFFLDATQSGRAQLSWDVSSDNDRSVLSAGSVAGFTLHAHVDQATADFRRLLIPSTAGTGDEVPEEITLNFDFAGSRCTLKIDYDGGSLSQMVSGVPYTFSLTGTTGKLTLQATPKVTISLGFTSPTEGFYEAKYVSGLKGTMTGTFSTEAMPIEVLQNGEVYSGIAGGFGERRLFKVQVPPGQTELDIATFFAHDDWGYYRVADVFVKYGTPPSSTSRDYVLDDDHDADLVAIKNPKAGDWYVLLGFTHDMQLDLLASYGNSAAYPYQVTPQKQTVTDEGGYYEAQVSADPSADLAVIPSESWIQLDSIWYETGRWVVSYYVNENWSQIPRSAVIMIGNRFLTVTQAAGR